jgi:hypothetical protein
MLKREQKHANNGHVLSQLRLLQLATMNNDDNKKVVKKELSKEVNKEKKMNNKEEEEPEDETNLASLDNIYNMLKPMALAFDGKENFSQPKPHQTQIFKRY